MHAPGVLQLRSNTGMQQPLRQLPKLYLVPPIMSLLVLLGRYCTVNITLLLLGRQTITKLTTTNIFYIFA